MKKQRAVTSVKVSLNDGLTILDLAPGNTITVAEIRRIIKNNGFPTKEGTVIAGGAAAADGRTFVVSGTNEKLTMSSPPRKSGDDWKVQVPAPEKP